jgi:hypothetical protein
LAKQKADNSPKTIVFRVMSLSIFSLKTFSGALIRVVESGFSGNELKSFSGLDKSIYPALSSVGPKAGKALNPPL